ncbi:hypothetical protein GOODEAATRI_005504 [Goodea atripinnis]|uniref:MCM10 OB-fold domain-containing protein n=1 Tax=Goodea atripinnis TaxID=208336 RepID=A0ABV0MF98_9TELE
MDSEDDLDILTALLAENEDADEVQDGQEQADDLDGLFDDDDRDEEEYNEGSEGEGAATEAVVSDLFGDLSNADSFKRKPRVAHQPKASPPEDRKPLMEVKIGSSFQPLESTSEPSDRLLSPAPSHSRSAPAGPPKPAPQPPVPKDVGVEKYSGLRLRNPRVSSSEMDRKMADRRLIRLSRVPDCLKREKLEDSDWGKTFSIWKLNDLQNLDVFVSLLLFGDVHKEHWKMEPGTVIGLLNPNPMKQRDGYEGVSGRFRPEYDAWSEVWTASKPNKPVQKTLDKLFVRGSAQLISQAKRLGKHGSSLPGLLLR